VKIRLANKSDILPLTGVLVRAFSRDPALRWFFPGQERYQKKAPYFFSIHLKQKIRRNMVYTNSNLTGAALWDPPGAMGLSRIERWEFRFYLHLMHGADFSRTIAGRTVLGQVRPAFPHWYLSILGVDPPFQGQGIGAALLQPVFAVCERDNIPAFLETAHESSLKFYLKLGFIKTGEFKLPDGPILSTLLRKPS